MPPEQSEESKLLEADMIVSCFYSAFKSGEFNLENVPGLLLRIINENMWQKRIMRTGVTVEFTRFIDFVTTKPLEGLGENLEAIKRLCRDNPKALDAIDRVVTGKHGGDRKSDDIKFNNVKLEKPPMGNKKSYALRRLRKSRPDLHQKVLNKKMTAHKAMIEAGFRKQTFTITKDIKSAVAFISKNFTMKEIEEIKCRL